jgi:hypothetical protein
MDFAHMAQSLTRRDLVAADTVRASASKTDCMREALSTGQKTARDLAAAAGLSSTAAVGALLKADIRNGRVRHDSGLYWLNPNYDEEQRVELAKAAAMLRRHGYTVSPPANQKGPL